MKIKPDIFGKYSNKMKKYHENIIYDLFENSELKLKKINVVINQMTFTEYLESKHDSEYNLYLVHFKKGKDKKPIMICLNKYFYKANKNAYLHIIGILNNLWMKYTSSNLDYIKKLESSSDLELNNREMVQTIHYLY